MQPAPATPAPHWRGLRGGSRRQGSPARLTEAAKQRGKEGDAAVAVSATNKQSLSEAERGSPFPFSPAASTHPRRPGRGGRRDRPLRQGPAPTVRQLHGAGAAQRPRQPVKLLHGSLHPRSAQRGAAASPRCRRLPSAHRGAGGAEAAQAAATPGGCAHARGGAGGGGGLPQFAFLPEEGKG